MTPAEFDRRERAYDLAQVRAARPKGPGECRQCLTWARARFPVLVACMSRVLVDHCCARCAMTPPHPDAHRYCVEVVTRAQAERILAEPGE